MEKNIDKLGGRNNIGDKLSISYTGIGSLPFKNPNAPTDATNYIFECCPDFPYWVQLPHFKKEEDMALQFTQNLLGLKFDEKECRYYLDDTTDDFFEGLETLFIDYETTISSDDIINCDEILDKYKITKPYSNTIDIFLKKLGEISSKNNNIPNFIKGSVTGPFTFSTSFCDNGGKSAYYNETLREVIVKTLSLKALWQIKEFKKTSPKSIPVIFLDEPSISQVGSCAFVTVKKDDVIEMLKTISDNIKKFGAISGIHCCGKTDWDIAIKSGVDIINFDAYFYAQSIGTYAKQLEKFIQNGGFLSFGIVPTLDKEALANLTSQKLQEKFMEAIGHLTSKNIDKDLILKQCFITPSCGCGSLDADMAKKALDLTKKLSESLKSKYESVVKI